MNFQKIINEAKIQGIEEIELYVETTKSTSISIYENEVDSFDISDIKKISARGIYKGKMGYSYTENISEDKIGYIIDEIKKTAETISTDDPFIIYEGSKEYPVIETEENDFDDHSVAEKIDFMKKLYTDLTLKDSRIVKISGCSYTENCSTVEIVNSLGLNIKKEENYCFAYASVVGSDGGANNNDSSYDIKERFEYLDKDKIAKEAVDKCVKGLNPQTIESGEYKVMFANTEVSSLLSAFSSVFSGESVIKNLSLIKDKVGEKVFGDNITIYDDPLNKESFIKSAFDDEGVASYKKAIVEKGVLKLFLQNLSTAKKLGTNPTGNGYKANGKIGVSPVNLYLEPGETSYDDMVKTLKDGIIVTELQGLHAGLNPISGDFSLQSTGFVVKNGEISHPISLFVVAGNFYKMFNNVSLIGSDMKFTLSGVGAPSIIIDKMMVSGK